MQTRVQGSSGSNEAQNRRATISIHIVTYNSAATIDSCLDAVFKQSYRDLSVVVIDNASSDNTVQIVERWIPCGVTLVRNQENLYFSRAHNMAIDMTQSEYVLTLNPDVIIYPDYLSHVLHAFSTSPRIGSVNGKLLLTRQGEVRTEFLLQQPAHDAIIDGAGLIMYKSRRPYLRGNRQRHGVSCLRPHHIFGVDAACGAYRRAMLEDIACSGEYFDNDFVIYREDVDLAWRAMLFGWDSYYVPAALGYHARAFQLGRERRAVLPSLRRHSVRNGWLLIVKNDTLPSLARCAREFVPYQLKIGTGMASFERSSLPAIAETAKLMPKMLRKREYIQARRRRSEEEMRLWFE